MIPRHSISLLPVKRLIDWRVRNGRLQTRHAGNGRLLRKGRQRRRGVSGGREVGIGWLIGRHLGETGFDRRGWLVRITRYVRRRNGNTSWSWTNRDGCSGWSYIASNAVPSKASIAGTNHPIGGVGARCIGVARTCGT